jgi:hypothetical protein
MTQLASQDRWRQRPKLLGLVNKARRHSLPASVYNKSKTRICDASDAACDLVDRPVGEGPSLAPVLSYTCQLDCSHQHDPT